MEDAHSRHRAFIADRLQRPAFFAIGCARRFRTLANLFDAASGKIRWKTSTAGQSAHASAQYFGLVNTRNGRRGRVYAAFWDGQAIHLGADGFKDGQTLWIKDLGDFKSQHGFGHSPMLLDGKVILANDQDGSSHLLAFDAKNGELVWQTERKPFRACYSTPFVHDKPDGGKELIVASTAGITSYNPQDGKPNWWYTWKFSKMPLRTVGSPIVAGNLVIATSGDGAGDRHVIAVKLGGKGDVTATNLAWENRKDYPFAYVPCLLSHGDYLFSIHDKGVASCHRQHWRGNMAKSLGQRFHRFSGPDRWQGVRHLSEWFGLRLRGGGGLQAAGQEQHR